MANAKKKPPKTKTTTNKKVENNNNKKKTPPSRSKKTPEKVPESATIEAAFKRASLGRRCPICNIRLVNAVYQRHLAKCKLQPIPDAADDEIIWCGNYSPSGTPISSARAPLGVLKREKPATPLQESLLVTKKIFRVSQANADDVSTSAAIFVDEMEKMDKQIEIAKVKAENSKPCTSSSLATKENRPISGDSFSKFTKDDYGLPLVQVFNFCLDYLETYLERHKYQPGQQSKQEVELSPQEQLPTSSNSMVNKEDEDNVEDNLPMNVHYALRFLWKIIRDVLTCVISFNKNTRIKVLHCPEHEGKPEQSAQFWGESLRVILAFLNSSVKAQQLFVYVLKRRWGWQRGHDFGLDRNISRDLGRDVMPIFVELCENDLMETAFKSATINVEDSLRLLKGDDLQPLCKVFKINAHIGKQLILDELKKYSTQNDVLGRSNKLNLFRNIRAQIGECFRISSAVFDLFSAFLSVYAPLEMDTSQLLDPMLAHQELRGQLMYTMLRQQNGDLTFMAPSTLSCSLLGIYSNLDELMSYIKAKNCEQKICTLVDKNAYDDAHKFSVQIRKTFEQEFLNGEQPRISRFAELPVYLRKFTAPWVYCRCLFHGVEAAQRIRNYEVAVEWLQFMVEHEELKNFCVHSRGEWYHRIALNLESHLKDREMAAEFCFRAIQDPLVGDPDRLALQNRLEKLSTRLDWSTKGQLPIRLVDPEEVHIVGKILAKGLGDGKQMNHFYFSSPPRKSASSTSNNQQQGERGDMVKCSVEELALRHFIEREGFAEGVHAEGQLWHCLFRLFFQDIIFCTELEAANIWISQLQMDPLDLNYSAFYANRRHLIDTRLEELLHSTPAHLVHLFRNHDLLKTYNDAVASKSHIGYWHFEQQQLSRLLACCPAQLLHDIFKRFCTNFRFNRSGFPDLTVWDANTGKLAVVEVKGPGDQLSTKQRLWLDFFSMHGVRAVVCHVAAKNDRALE